MRRVAGVRGRGVAGLLRSAEEQIPRGLRPP